MIRHYRAGQSCAQVGKRFGVTAQAVWLMLARNNEPSRARYGSKPWAEPETVIDLYRSGQSCAQIGKLFGVSDTTVLAVLARHDEPRRIPGRRHVEKPPTAREAAMIGLYRGGQSLDAVGGRFGVRRTTVWKVLLKHNEPRRTIKQATVLRHQRRIIQAAKPESPDRLSESQR
jgi:transposase